MEAFVDRYACMGCALCMVACPSVFEMDGGVARVKGGDIPAREARACREAAEGCPGVAITLVDGMPARRGGPVDESAGSRSHALAGTIPQRKRAGSGKQADPR